MNIIITGKGGDGVISMGKIIAKAAVEEDKDVISYENHGHAKRGGPVSCHIRIGKAFAPKIPFKQADLIVVISGEPCIEYLKENGKIINPESTGIRNSFLLGYISNQLPISKDSIKKQLKQFKNYEENMKSFYAGINSVHNEQ